MADEKQGNGAGVKEETKSVVTKPKVVSVSKEVAIEELFRHRVFSLIELVGRADLSMADARQVLTGWYQALSEEEAQKVAIYGRDFLSRLKSVAEAVHQQWSELIAPRM